MTPKLSKTAAGQLILQKVRAINLELFEPVSFKNDPKNTARFGATVLIPKDAVEVVDQLLAEINKLAKDKHKITKLPFADSCLQDGDEKAFAALHGHMVLSAYAYPSAKSQNGGAPQVLNRGKGAIRKGDSCVPYSGAYCTILFDLYAPNSWKKVSAGLKVVHYLEQGGEPIGSSTDLSELPDMPDLEDGGFE